MAQTALTPITLKENNYAVVAGDLNLTPVAMDATNGNSFVATGQEILLILNSDTATHTFTISSVGDSLGRSDTSLTAYVVPVAVGGLSGVVAIQMKALAGWIQSGQVVDLTTSSALLKIIVLRYS
jgi:hypothetical protein